MNKFPYTNFHDINLDWIIKQVREFSAKLNAFSQKLATFISIPAGGATGQALVKRSAANYDVEWDTISGGSSVYNAVYGTTTNADIYAAYTAGMAVQCDYNNHVYALFNCTPTMAYFSYINGDVSAYLECFGNTWANDSERLALLANVHNIPDLGTTGQALVKNSNDDYDVTWATISGGGAVDSVDGKTGTVTVLPIGGTAGQALTKIDGTNYNVQWQTISGSTPELFWAIYGTSTFTEVETAITSGKFVVMDYGTNIILYASSYNTGSTIVFSTYTQTVAYKCSVLANNTWTPLATTILIPRPSGAVTGQYLQWNGTSWIAADLPLYSGGVNP